MSKPGDVLKHSVGTPPATTFPGGINAKQFGVLSPTTSALIGTILANAGETLIATKDAGGSYAPMVEGAAAKEGSGPLANLSSVGVFNSLANVTTKHLGQVDDDPAGTWRRVGSVNAANKIVSASLADGAVTTPKIASGAINAQQMQSATIVYSVFANPTLVQRTRG